MQVLEHGLLPDYYYSYEESLIHKKEQNNDFRGVIYCTVNMLDGKIYIGKDELNRRSYIGSGKHFLRAVKKYGKENFIKYIIDVSAHNVKELDDLEVKYIYPHLHKPYCYNIAPGGEGPTWWKSISKERYDEIRHNMSVGGKGKKLSPEHVAKMTIASTGRKHTQETKDKIREKNTGRKFTEEHCQHISESCKSKKLSEEHKQHISDSQKGKQVSQETRQKLREINLGKKLSEEHKHNISEAKKGKKDSPETRAKKSASHKRLNQNNPECHAWLSQNTKHRNELCGNPIHAPGAIEKMLRTRYRRKLIKEGYSEEEAELMSIGKYPIKFYVKAEVLCPNH